MGSRAGGAIATCMMRGAVIMCETAFQSCACDMIACFTSSLHDKGDVNAYHLTGQRVIIEIFLHIFFHVVLHVSLSWDRAIGNEQFRCFELGCRLLSETFRCCQECAASRCLGCLPVHLCNNPYAVGVQ